MLFQRPRASEGRAHGCRAGAELPRLMNEAAGMGSGDEGPALGRVAWVGLTGPAARTRKRAAGINLGARMHSRVFLCICSKRMSSASRE